MALFFREKGHSPDARPCGVRIRLRRFEWTGVVKTVKGRKLHPGEERVGRYCEIEVLTAVPPVRRARTHTAAVPRLRLRPAAVMAVAAEAIEAHGI